MPVNQKPRYRPPRFLRNRHLQTIYPSLIRRVPEPEYVRERIDTPDGDFLDLDWVKRGNAHLVIISHGLEGNSTRPYVTGMANLLSKNSYDILAWNYRGCSGETNKKVFSYHSGATYDLCTVVSHAVALGYEKISLLGFSLGGNMTLKYLGEKDTFKPEALHSAVVFSVPLDLRDCAITIHLPSNFLYERRFLYNFFKKINDKALLFEEIDEKLLRQVKSVYDFDQLFTAPLNGFESAIDYYERCSSMQFVKTIEIPTLVVNAVNDPFLGAKCFNPKEFEKTSRVQLELPDTGGHCGFPLAKSGGYYWSELRALDFLIENE